MTIGDLFYAAISGVAPGHVWNTQAADDETAAHVVFTRISTAPSQTLANGAPQVNTHYQIDCYHGQYEGAQALADSVKAALAAASFVALRTNETDGYESATRQHRIMLEYSVWST